MKKRFQSKYLTMILFLGFLAVMYLMNIPPLIYGCKVAASEFVHNGTLSPSHITQAHSNNFWQKESLINLNGGIHRLLGARAINDRYLMDNGQMTYTLEKYDMSEGAQKTLDFYTALREKNIPMVYVNAPFKIPENEKQLPVGIEDFSNENANQFLSILKANQVPVLDLREKIADDGLNYEEIFYYTDHHWRVETGLWATAKILDFLEELDPQLTTDKQVADPANYNVSTYENIFLGSAGRRAGTLYVKPDDFNVITPKFDTDISFFINSSNLIREGKFEDTLLFKEHLTSDGMLDCNTYSTYSGDDVDLIKILNKNPNNGISCSPKKILIIKDSFFKVVFPFLSLGYAQTHVIDLRAFSEDLMSYIQDYQPDLVMVMYNQGAYEQSNSDMFHFLP